MNRKMNKKVNKKPGSSQRVRLENELVKILKSVDDEGLIFLLKQAHVIQHNMQVDKINKEIDILNTKKQPEQSGMEDMQEYKSSASQTQINVNIDIEELDHGKSFILIINNLRKYLTIDEIRSIIKICHAAEEKNDASKRLYKWFSLNRKDVLFDAKIGNAKNPLLALIYNFIISNYRIKKR